MTVTADLRNQAVCSRHPAQNTLLLGAVYKSSYLLPCSSRNTRTNLEFSFLFIFFHLFQVIIEGAAASVQLVAVFQNVSLLQT